MISENDKLFFPVISLRAKTAIIGLNKAKEKQDYNELSIRDGYGMAVYCDSVLRLEFNPSMLGDAYRVLMLDDLETGNPDRRKILQERINKVKKTRATLEKIIKKENVSEEEINVGISFFEELKERCMEYMDYPKI